MTDREKLIELLQYGMDKYFLLKFEAEIFADLLIKNGVTFAKDTNDGSKWISVEDDKPKENDFYLCWVCVSSVGSKEKYERRILYWEDNVWLVAPSSFKTMSPLCWTPLPKPPHNTTKQTADL